MSSQGQSSQGESSPRPPSLRRSGEADVQYPVLLGYSTDIEQYISQVQRGEYDHLPLDCIMDELEEAVHELRIANDHGPLTSQLHTVITGVHSRAAVLLHTIHPELLRCLVRNDLAYHFHDQTHTRWHNWAYLEEGPGTYACGITFRGRGGAFLSKMEIRVLIQYLQTYADACQCYEKDNFWEPESQESQGQSAYTHQQAAALRFAMEIDYIYKDGDWPGDELQRPRFAHGGETNTADPERHIHRLIENLRRRCDNDYNDRTWQRQSPLLVGCSDNVKKRLLSHKPISGLVQSAKVWGVLLSCLKKLSDESRGLQSPLQGTRLDIPEVVAVPIIKAFTPEDVSISEHLVTLLAGSYITLNGMNVRQPGEHRGSADTIAMTDSDKAAAYEKNKEEVYARRGWFKRNLDQTLEYRVWGDSKEAWNLKDSYEDMQIFDMAELEQAIADMSEAKSEHASTRPELDLVAAQATTRLAEVKKVAQEVEALVKKCPFAKDGDR